MEHKYIEIWESIFGKEEYSIDFTGQVILKNEFRTNKKHSWDFDNYDYNDELKFIASQNVIKVRNKQPIFTYKNKKYVVIKNENFTYSILSIDQLVEKDNPINYDLYLTNLIENWKDKKYIVLSITIKKMKSQINSIFISFLSNCIKENLGYEFLKLDNKNIYKDKIYFLIDTSQSDILNILKFTMKLKSIIQLFVFKSTKKFSNIWEYDEDVNNGFFFNLFIFENEKNSNEDIIYKNENNFVNYVETFEEKILLNKQAKISFENLGLLSEEFKILYDYDETTIYSYNYENRKFNAFNLKIKNRGI